MADACPASRKAMQQLTFEFSDLRSFLAYPGEDEMLEHPRKSLQRKADFRTDGLQKPKRYTL